MSIRALSTVLNQSRARGSAFAVSVALADFYNDEEGQAWPSIERLACMARLSTRAAQGALRELEELGEWSIDIGAGRWGTNVYRLNWQAFRAPIWTGQRQKKQGGAKSAGGANRGRRSAPKPKGPNRKPLAPQDLRGGGNREAASAAEILQKQDALEMLRNWRNEDD